MDKDDNSPVPISKNGPPFLRKRCAFLKDVTAFIMIFEKV